MSARDYFNSSYESHQWRPYQNNSPLPPTPPSASSKPLPAAPTVIISPIDEDDHGSRLDRYDDTHHQRNQHPYTYGHTNHSADPNPFSDSAAIPLQDHPSKGDYSHPYQAFPYRDAHLESAGDDRSTSKRDKRSKRKKPFLSWGTPWVLYTLTFIQIIVFIAEIGKNAALTGSPIEIHPQFNPLIGPSPYVLINMGARYVPCMRNQQGVQNSDIQIYWPCPNTTDTTAECSLTQLCGFSGSEVPNPHPHGSLDDKPAPNQWFRFITPIFLHSGLIHIAFNMLFQVLMGREIEENIGHIRFIILYFSCGIFGFVMSANFAGAGLASTGASGALFGIIALTLLDLLYTWPSRKKPWIDLIFIMLDIVICLVIGLLPWVDNFAHIGGLLMGLVLGLCLLRSPEQLRKHTNPQHDTGASNRNSTGSYTGIFSNKVMAKSPRFVKDPVGFFKGRKPLWWVWWLLRAGALVGVIIGFIVLLDDFYTSRNNCSWCKYLSCIPVNDWCSYGDLDFTSQNPPGR